MQPLVSVYRTALRVDPEAVLGPWRRGPGDPTCRRTADVSWRAFLTPAGPATLALRRVADGVECVAWGGGDDPGAAAEWAIAGCPALLGAEDDPSGFVAHHRIVADLHRSHPDLRLGRSGLVLDALAPAVLEQKVTGREAWEAWRHLVRRFGSAAPGPQAGLLVAPSARDWAAIPSWEWHRAGVDDRRASTLVRAARVAPSLERSTRESADGRLRSVPGVGQWTSAEVRARAFGDPDAVSVGDFHLAAFVGWALVGQRVDDDGMLELLEPYAGHRQRVVRLLEGSGLKPPRFGPRASIPAHRRI